MQEFETIANDGTKYTFSFETMAFINHKRVNIKRWMKGYSYNTNGFPPMHFSFARTIVSGQILWQDIEGITTDHVPLEVRRYIGKVAKNLAFT